MCAVPSKEARLAASPLVLTATLLDGFCRHAAITRTQVFVDPVGPHEVYEAKLRAIFPTLQFTVVPKADALFPVVSAASIVAKVTRDVMLEVWAFSEAEARAGLGADREFGSGYPSGASRSRALLDRHAKV